MWTMQTHEIDIMRLFELKFVRHVTITTAAATATTTRKKQQDFCSSCKQGHYKEWKSPDWQSGRMTKDSDFWCWTMLLPKHLANIECFWKLFGTEWVVTEDLSMSLNWKEKQGRHSIRWVTWHTQKKPLI